MIVVFGSLVADLVFPLAALPRPGETVAAQRLTVFPGGKGANQAVAAARAGSSAQMIGRVGRDAFGDVLEDGLVRAGVIVDGVAEADAATGCAAVCVDPQGRNQIALALAANLEARAEQVPQSLLGPRSTLLLQMEVPAAENWALIRRARAARCRILLNWAPAGAVDEAAMRDVDYVLVNELEAVALARALSLKSRVPRGIARAVAKRLGVGCVVTLGAAGAVASLGSGDWKVGALAIVPVDTTGAGDAFVGVFAAALDHGLDERAALHRASVAGGIACLSAGAQPSLPERAAVDARLSELAAPRPG